MAIARLVPSSYEVSSTYLHVSNETNMYTNTDSTSYATIENTQKGTTTYYLYIRGFNIGDIPSNAIVNSLSFKLKGYMDGGYTSSSYAPKLCHGTSQITSTCSQLTTSVNTYTFTGYNLDIDDLRGYGDTFGIRINCRRAKNNTTAYFYIYGAEIEVNYNMPLRVKQNGTYVEVLKAYEKVNNVWVEKTDHASVFTSGVNYKYEP